MSDPAPESPVPCPCCGEAMDTFVFEELDLHTCPDHGFWFAADKLERLLQRAAGEARRGLQARKRLVSRPEARWGAYAENARRRLERWRARYRQRRRLGGNEVTQPTQAGPTPPSSDRVPRSCPACRRPLEVEVRKDHFKETPDVSVNACPEHGLWLDHGKVEVLLERASLDALRNVVEKLRRARRDRYEWEEKNTD